MTPSTLTKRFAAMLPMLAVVILGTWGVSADVIAAGRGIWVAQAVLTGILVGALLSLVTTKWERLRKAGVADSTHTRTRQLGVGTALALGGLSGAVMKVVHTAGDHIGPLIPVFLGWGVVSWILNSAWILRATPKTDSRP